jgi:hypothetical protein
MKKIEKTKKPRGGAMKARGRGNPQGPPERGIRGHSSIDQQPGFAKWLEEQLLEEPKPTYDEVAERLKGTGFYASRSALHRYGLKFEVQRREMKILLDKARVLAQEDPETILVLEKATSNLAMTKLFNFLLANAGDDATLGEETLGAMFAAARLQSSSASRERAAVVANGKFRTAMRAMQRALEEKLRSKPEVLKQVLALLDKAHTEVAG